MEIKQAVYKTLDDAAAYFSLLQELYGRNPAAAYYLSDLRTAMSYTLECPHQKSTCILLGKEAPLMGHGMLIQDERLPGGEAFFGFLECQKDPDEFTMLWNGILQLARDRGVKRLHGPVSGSIWHSYRVQSYSDPAYPLFNSEPVSQAWYYDAFRALKPAEIVGYYSASRKSYDFLVDYTRPSWERSRQLGYRIEEVTVIDPQIMQQILALSKKVFRNSWSYTDLDHSEFINLYSARKIGAHIGRVYLLTKGDDLAGFCITLKDQDKLIFKTIAIDPGHQEKGLGNALVYRIHQDALQEKIPEIIYALIRDTNKVQHFPKDDVVIFREYACFTFDLN